MSGVLPEILARETLRSPVASLTPLAHSQTPCRFSDLHDADRRQGRECARCNVWPLHHQSGSVPAPRHPITKGRLRSPLEPIAQSYADWMSTIVFARWITSRGVPAPCNPVHAKFSPHSLLIAQQSSNFLLGELCIHWLHSCHVREGFRLSNSGGTPAARTVLAGMSIQ